MPASTSPRFLHVANGTATTETIRQAGIPGALSIWADPLHEGPVPGQLSDAALLEVRARYLSSDAPDFDARVGEITADMQQWRDVIADDVSYDELILWYEHDLFDQLNLIQLLSWIRRTLPSPKTVSLICIDAFPGHPRFKGLGELSPGELASLLETRLTVSAPQYELAVRAWDAFRAPDPASLAALVRTDMPALPFLAAALRRHLEDYPWTRDGLSRTERKLMALARPGPIDIWKTFPAMHEDETAFYIADSSFWTIVEGLQSAVPGLVTVDVTSTVPGRLPSGTIALTDTGRAVLDGQLDRVEQCGIDRWLGGVRLTGSQPLWRWDHAQQRICQC